MVNLDVASVLHFYNRDTALYGLVYTTLVTVTLRVIDAV
jgi:hypothetical protein